jgi:transposase InsO family protein
VLRRPVESTQYLAIRYTERLAEAGALPSIGSVGDSYDNAMAESIIGLYKSELITMRGPWRTVERMSSSPPCHRSSGGTPPASTRHRAYHTRRATATPGL